MDNHYYRNEATQIITELYDEFSREEMKLKVKYDNNCSRLEEMDQQIRMMSKTEDVDMRAFSPRRHVSSENDKIIVMKKEREELDKVNREIERDYRYFSKRAEKLRYLSDLMDRDAGVFMESGTNEDFTNIQSKETTPAEETSPAALRESMEKIQKRLDSIYHFIDTDTPRAKLEIKNLLILITETLA
ncbi:MAG: hypothetical protein K5649_04130 [Lachnospiraceae bacterium]|nr:hypothetical protein [Lachnospiraceae bacterium]